LQKSSIVNSQQALFNRGCRFFEGRGVLADLTETARYFKLSADQHDARGQFNHIVCLRDGDGVPMNSAEAAGYFKLSADHEN
jgi:TPR repeat protein